MIEIIKELSVLLKDLPDLAIWIMLGLLFYKVFIIGGAYSLAKFVVTKLHSVLTMPQEVKKTYEYKITDFLYTHDRADLALSELLNEIVTFRHGGNIEGHKLCRDDVLWLKEAHEEKLKRDGVTKSYEMKAKNRD